MVEEGGEASLLTKQHASHQSMHRYKSHTCHLQSLSFFSSHSVRCYCRCLLASHLRNVDRTALKHYWVYDKDPPGGQLAPSVLLGFAKHYFESWVGLEGYCIFLIEQNIQVHINAKTEEPKKRFYSLRENPCFFLVTHSTKLSSY